ncbi:hypothetical protein pVco7_gp079 [Vibrio phage pVco-7]
MSSLNEQHGGTHYNIGIQPIEYIHTNNLNFFEGNAIKYITRHRSKNGAEDLKKAIHYAQMILEMDYGIKSNINFENPSESNHAATSTNPVQPKPELYVFKYNPEHESIS